MIPPFKSVAMKILFYLSLICMTFACQKNPERKISEKPKVLTVPSLVILGNIQDAGSPHIGCTKDCCSNLWENPDVTRKVTSIAIVDPKKEKTWLFEATPDMPSQLHYLSKIAPYMKKMMPSGIFITHAHIGHYPGLMYLGREAIGAKGIPVYTMPKMSSFLENNGPWSQLVDLKNITINRLKADSTSHIDEQLKITPLIVPHRDEYSETAGFLIEAGSKKIFFAPDTDKWDEWGISIIEIIKKVDLAIIDGTFYNEKELSGRSTSDVPHPFIKESIELFKNLSVSEKNKIIFIHFNHTNPILKNEQEKESLINQGYRIAEFGMTIPL